MIITGTKELKSHLEEYLVSVKNGEEIMITTKGKTIARIIREPAKKLLLHERLSSLAANGLIELPLKEFDKIILAPESMPGKPLSRMVIEDRR